MLSFTRYFGLVIIIFLFFTSCKKEEYAAEVGDLFITKEELKKALEIRYAKRDNYKGINYDRKKELLDNLIGTKLKLNAAYDADLDQDSTVQSELNSILERSLARRYYEKFVVDKLVTQADIDEYIENQNTEVKAAQILISHSKAYNKIQRSREEAKNLAAELTDRAKKGEDFSKLVANYSDDPLSKAEKGDMGWFSWGRMPNEFQQAAWTMQVGEIQGPVESSLGYHIIRLDDRRKRQGYNPPETEEEWNAVKREIFAAHGDSGQVLWEEQREKLKSQYNFSLDKTGILSLSASITEHLQSGRVTVASLSEEEKNIKLADFDGGAITLNAIINRNRSRINQILVKFKQADFLETEVDGIGVFEIVLLDAYKHGLDEEESIRRSSRQFLERKILYLIEKQELSDQVTIDDEGTRMYYEQNPDKFIKPAEIELWEIMVKDKNLAESIVAKLKKGSDFTRLVQEYSEDSYTAKKEGYVGFRAIGARGDVSKEAFKLGPGGKIGGPVRYRKGWIVFKTGDLKEESIRPYKNVKNRAESMLRRERIEQKRVEWKKDLRKKYTVKINEELVKSI